MRAHQVTLLGTGLIGDFYTATLHSQRGRDRVRVVYSRSEERGRGLQRALGHPRAHDRSRGGGQPPGDRCGDHRPAQLRPRGGGGRRREGRQGGAVHQAARPQRRRGAPHARDGRVGGHLRGLPRGPVLHPEVAEGLPRRARRRRRRCDLGPLSGGTSRPALGLVLGWPADRRRRDHRPRLPLHRDRPQLRRQGEPPGRGDVPHRHAGAPDRRRGQRHRADPVRVRRHRPVRGELDVPRRDGPARRGGGHARHDLAESLPAHRVRDVLRGRVRRVRGGEGGDERRLALPGGRRVLGARLRRHVQRHVRRDGQRIARRWRPSTTATSSTR